MPWLDMLISPVGGWIIGQFSVRRRQQLVALREQRVQVREHELGDLSTLRQEHSGRITDFIVAELLELQPRLGRPDTYLRTRWNNFSLIPLELEYTETSISLPALNTQPLLAEKHQRTHNKPVSALWHEETEDAVPLFANIVDGVREVFKEPGREHRWMVSCSATFRRTDTGERLTKIFEHTREVPNFRVGL